MQRFLTAALLPVLLLIGCRALKHSPVDSNKAPCVRKDESPRLNEEKVALALICEQYKHVKVLRWGPHDMEGKIAALAAQRRKEGWTEFPETHDDLLASLKPGTTILRIEFRYISGVPRKACVLVCFRDGKPIRFKNFLGVLDYFRYDEEARYDEEEGETSWIDNMLWYMRDR